MKHLRHPLFIFCAIVVIILIIVYMVRVTNYEYKKLDAIEKIRLGKQELEI